MDMKAPTLPGSAIAPVPAIDDQSPTAQLLPARAEWDRAVAACHEGKAAHSEAIRASKGLHPSDAAEAALRRWDEDLRRMVATPAPDLAALAEKLEIVRSENMQSEEGVMGAIVADVSRLDGARPEQGGWKALREEYRYRRALKVADEKYGPLGLANLARKLKPGPGTAAAEEAVLAEHMTRHWEPWILAGLALVRSPAPDSEAVNLKLAVMEEAGLEERVDDGDPELFEIIRADVERLSRPVASEGAAWAATQAAYTEARATCQSAPPQETAAADDALCDAETDAYDALMATPAPDFAAVIEKLRMIRRRYSDDGFATPDLHADQIEADLRRLARA